jgi:RNA polymerase sigma factor (sigma-70 family)
MSSTLAREEASNLVFERLYRRHRGDVYSFVLRDLRNPDEAEDVTQTAFLNAYRALQRGDEPKRPRAWLLTIAQNVTRRRFRMRATRPQEVPLDPDVAVAVEPEGPTAREIREALERLRPNQRAVLVLREIGGFSYAEIAEELGLSMPAVETLIFRARRALRAELTGEEIRPKRAVGLALSGLAELAARLLGWLGRRGVAAKAAGAAGVAAVATGVAVQAGALALPADGGQQAREEPAAAVLASSPAGSPVLRARQARAEKAKPAKSRPRRAQERPAEPAAAAEPGVGVPGVPGVPNLSVTDVSLPEVALPELSVPEVSAPPLPPLPLPEATLPPLPDTDLLP